MSKGKMVLLVAVGVVLLILVSLYGFFKGNYNRFVSLDEAAKTSWAQVENQLQRRYDLIPNLVETVKGYAKFEQETLIQVTNARARVGGMANASQADQMKAQNELGSALSRLLVVVERYPELKANQNFLRLQDELAGTENRISVERKRYNDAVQAYNVAIRSFPANILAGMFGFTQKPLFEAPQEAKAAPKVKF
jgi:LemA protein